MFKLAKLDKIFSILLFAAVPIGLYFAFFYAPVERIMGIVQKIFYFHVASAWIGFAAFFVTFVASILYLITKKYTFDDIAAASAEMGQVLDLGPTPYFYTSFMVYICRLYYAKAVYG